MHKDVHTLMERVLTEIDTIAHREGVIFICKQTFFTVKFLFIVDSYISVEVRAFF